MKSIASSIAKLIETTVSELASIRRLSDAKIIDE